MTCRRLGIASHLTVWLAVLGAHPASAQQFNSDNYLSKPAGVATIILTVGERSDIMMTTFLAAAPTGVHRRVLQDQGGR